MYTALAHFLVCLVPGLIHAVSEFEVIRVRRQGLSKLITVEGALAFGSQQLSHLLHFTLRAPAFHLCASKSLHLDNTLRTGPPAIMQATPPSASNGPAFNSFGAGLFTAPDSSHVELVTNWPRSQQARLT